MALPYRLYIDFLKFVGFTLNLIYEFLIIVFLFTLFVFQRLDVYFYE